MPKSASCSLVYLLIACLFLFTRLYKIQSSLLFFNDMGRDFLALDDWQISGKLPLLGPQTSAFSSNQSPVYYYLLYPVFVLSHHSPFATIITGIFWYLGWFGFGLFLFRRQPAQLTTLCLLAILMTFAPQILRQNRFIWNPSFTPPLLVACCFAYQSLLTRFSTTVGWFFAVSGALAIGLTLASLPLVALLLLSLFFQVKSRRWLLLGQMMIAGLLVFAPLLVFEFRHHFTLTYLLLHGQHLPQTATALNAKLSALLTFMPGFLSLVLMTLFVFIKIPRVRVSATLTLVLLLFTLIAPVNLESHYIFPLLTLFIFTIAQFRLIYAIPVTIALCVYWLFTPTFQDNFKPAVRTVSQLQSCYQNFCTRYPQALYVSMQSGILPYHNAPEHRYFMRQSGCQVLDIEASQNQSSIMAVVVDNSVYEQGKTAYNELTLFGPSTDTGTFVCQPNLSIHVLKKI